VGILRGENDQGFRAEESVFLEIKAEDILYFVLFLSSTSILPKIYEKCSRNLSFFKIVKRTFTI